MKKIADALLKIAKELKAAPTDALKQDIKYKIDDIDYRAQDIQNFCKKMKQVNEHQEWDTKKELEILSSYESKLKMLHTDFINELRAEHKKLGRAK